MKEKEHITCDLCGKEGARLRHIPRSYGKGVDLLVVENVPVVSCPNCGESYLTAETLKTLDHIRSARRRAADKRPIAVARFG